MIEIPAFYDADALERIAITLFHGWGYNFYRAENQLRADDQLVRGKVGWLLGSARASVAAAESAYRRVALPPPSRANPRPDPAAIAGAHCLERLAAAIGAVAGQVHSLPVPENDRMTQRYRSEGATLETLVRHDQRLAAQAEMLRATLDGQPGDRIIANATAIEAALAALATSLRERQVVLMT